MIHIYIYIKNRSKTKNIYFRVNDTSCSRRNQKNYYQTKGVIKKKGKNVLVYFKS